MNTTENTPTIPDTPQELLKKNQEPLNPKDIWGEVCKLSIKEQEVFLWNLMDRMKGFHKGVVDMMMEEDEYSKEDIYPWMVDGMKYQEMMRTMETIIN